MIADSVSRPTWQHVFSPTSTSQQWVPESKPSEPSTWSDSNGVYHRAPSSSLPMPSPFLKLVRSPDRMSSVLAEVGSRITGAVETEGSHQDRRGLVALGILITKNRKLTKSDRQTRQTDHMDRNTHFPICLIYFVSRTPTGLFQLDLFLPKMILHSTLNRINSKTLVDLAVIVQFNAYFLKEDT